MSANLPMYERDGRRLLLELEPLSYEEWCSGEPIDEERRKILDVAEALSLKSVQSTRLRALSYNITLELVFMDSTRAILHCPATLDDGARRKFEAEMTITNFLQSTSQIPIPNIIATQDDVCLSLTTLIDGLDAAHAYPAYTSVRAKDRSIISYAPISIEIFRLDVPQCLGSAVRSEAPLAAGSFVSIKDEHCVDFAESKDLRDFFRRIVQGSSLSFAAISGPAEYSVFASRLDRLLSGLEPFIEEVSQNEHMMRFSLFHHDLRPNNIILNSVTGDVQGVIDWEYHGFLPAVLCADYPSWISHSGPEDPSIPNLRGPFQHLWYESPDECVRLRTLYEQTVKELDAEYYDCLVSIAGQKLRAAVQWLTTSNTQVDPGLDMFSSWIERELWSPE